MAEFMIVHKLDDLIDDIVEAGMVLFFLFVGWGIATFTFFRELMFVSLGPYLIAAGMEPFNTLWFTAVCWLLPFVTLAMVMIVVKVFIDSPFEFLGMPIVFLIFSLNLWFVPACTSKRLLNVHAQNMMTKEEQKKWSEWYEEESSEAADRRELAEKIEKVRKDQKKIEDIGEQMEKERLERVRKAKEKFQRSTQVSGD